MQASYLRISYDLSLIEYDINNTFLVFLASNTHSRHVAYDSVSSENLIFNDTKLNVIVNATVSTNTLLHYRVSRMESRLSFPPTNCQRNLIVFFRPFFTTFCCYCFLSSDVATITQRIVVRTIAIQGHQRCSRVGKKNIAVNEMTRKDSWRLFECFIERNVVF